MVSDSVKVKEGTVFMVTSLVILCSFIAPSPAYGAVLGVFWFTASGYLNYESYLCLENCKDEKNFQHVRGLVACESFSTSTILP